MYDYPLDGSEGCRLVGREWAGGQRLRKQVE